MITLFYAGALTFLGLILAGRIVSIRLSDQVLLGTADNKKPLDKGFLFFYLYYIPQLLVNIQEEAKYIAQTD